MKYQSPMPLSGIMLACAVALPLAGCSNKKDKAEIESLKQEVLDRESSLDSLRTRSEDLERAKSELTSKVNEAENKSAALQSQLDQAKADLESLRNAKSNETAAQSRPQSPAKALEASKAQLTKQLAAVVTIEGDVASGRGTVVQADGKTWLYTTPQVLSGNSKISIKTADGAAVTKFGAFNLAPDANLARLEIQQDMPVKFDVDSAAAIDPNTTLMAVSSGAGNSGGTATPQTNECHATRTVGNDFEIESYAIQQSGGCPVIDGTSGKLVAIIGSAEPPPSLWPGYQQNTGTEQNAKAARLNRTIDWKTTTIAGFLAERHKIEDLNRTTRLLYALAAVKVTGEALQLDGSLGGSNSGIGGATTTVLKVLEQNASLPMVAEMMKIKSDLADKKMKVAARDINRRVASILGQAKSASSRQLQDLKTVTFSPYHRPAAELALKWRGEADQTLNTAIDAVGR